MYTLGRGLQILGMATLMMALYVGFTMERGTGPELLLLAIGCLFFIVGRLLEGRVR